MFFGHFKVFDRKFDKGTATLQNEILTALRFVSPYKIWKDRFCK